MGESGKPQACQNCKKRKVKCDYRKPACLRCEKTQITCKGYQRETVFINKTAGKARLVPQHPPHNPSQTSPPSLDDCLRDLAAQLQQPTSIRSQSQLRLQSLALLKKLYLPQLSPADLAKSPAFAWLPIVCYLQGASHALDHALYTLCAIQVAITKSGSIDIDEALQTYYSSLQTLQVELGNIDAARKDETIGAISVLSTCELFVCPTDHAWQAHAQGISQILLIRGDLDISTPVRKSLFFRIRLVLLFEALTKRLSRPTATSQCRQFSTQEEGRLDSLSQLIAIAWEVPAVLEESDRLMANTAAIPEHHPRSHIFQPSLDLIAKLQVSQQSYKDTFDTPVFWAMPSTADNPADEFYDTKFFPFALHFRSMESALNMVLYWAMLLQVHYNIICLDHHFHTPVISSEETHSFAIENSSVPPPRTWEYDSIASVKEEANTLARYICMSIEYCYRIEHGTLGPQLTCYAQWVLKLYFRKVGCVRGLAWCLNIKGMKGPGFHSGIELMCFEDGDFKMS